MARIILKENIFINEEFSDSAMFIHLTNFASEIISDSTSPQIKYNVRKFLLPIYSDIYLADLNKDKFVELLQTRNLASMAKEFVVYLCENNILPQNSDLYEYIPIIKNSLLCSNDTLIYLLTFAKTLDFISFKKVIIKDDIRLLSISLNNVSFIDNELKQLAEDYITETFKFGDSTSRALVNIAYTFITVCREELSQLHIKDMTLEVIRKIAGKYREQTWANYSLNMFLLYLNKHGYLYDDILKHICKIQTDNDRVFRNEQFLAVIESEHPERFVCVAHKRGNRLDYNLHYCNTGIPELFDAMVKYIEHDHQTGVDYKNMFLYFDESLNGATVSGIHDLNFDLFKSQLKYYKTNYSEKTCYFLGRFYYFMLSNYDSTIFDDANIATKTVQRNDFITLLLNDYDVLSYNRIEDVPHSNKWLLQFDNTSATNGGLTVSNAVSVNFEEIQNPEYRKWCKYYVWKGAGGVNNRIHKFNIMRTFFNYVDDLKSGKILTMHTNKTNNLAITTNEVFAYKNYILGQHDNPRTRIHYILDIATILKFINDEYVAKIESGVFYHLTVAADNDYNNTMAIADEDLKKLANLMKEKAKENTLNAIYHLVFYLGLETEFRISQLLNLTVDCVVETAKKGEYVIVSKTKTSNMEVVEQPITIYTKRHIDEILSLTNEYRADCVDLNVKTSLFITPSNRKGVYSSVQPSIFNAYLKDCCAELGIHPYTYQNLRDTHMTKAEEYVIRNGLSEISQGVLSGHRSSVTDTKHYVDTQIKEMLESVHGVIIGNVDINGMIQETISSEVGTKENSVSNQCGYCGCNNCSNLSNLDCLMCKDFVTTIDRLPYFEEQIKVLDFKLQNASIPHDKEDLVNIKRLHLGYVEKILKLKEEKLNGK